MVIRACTAEDLEALEWDGELAHDRAIIAATFARTAGASSVMLVAVDGRTHVGQIWVDFDRPPGVGLLWALRVKPAWRGRGIGTRLVEAAEHVIRGRGTPLAELELEPWNEAARIMYERRGYVHVRCELSGVRFHVLQKPLSKVRRAATARLDTVLAPPTRAR